MKKLLLFLLAAWGLTALSATARAQGGTTTPTTWPRPLTEDNYLLGNNYKTGAFVDLGAIMDDDAKMTAARLQIIMPLGSTLTTTDDLTKYCYQFDTEENGFVPKEITTNDKNANVWDFAAGDISFNFMGKPVKSMIISAVGGIYFSTQSTVTDDGGAGGMEPLSTEESAYPTIEYSLPGTDLDKIAAAYGVVIYPKTPIVANDEITGYELLPITRCQDDTVPAYLGIGSDEYGTFFVVQYQYSVNGKPWRFQIRCDSRGGVSWFVDNITNPMDQGYKLALGIKREDETMLLGECSGGWTGTSVIDDMSCGWSVSTVSKDRNVVVYPYGGITTIDNTKTTYTSIEASVELSPEIKTLLSDNDRTLLILASTANKFSQGFEDKNYQAGDNLQETRYIPVVYHGNPTLTDDAFSFSFDKLKVGTTYYLLAYTGEKTKKDGQDHWTYSDLELPIFVSESFSTKAVPSPTAVAVSAPQGNKVTLTIESEGTDCSYMVLKTRAGAVKFSPKGNLAVGAELEYEDSYNDVTYTATVAGFAENAKTLELTLAEGEATYFHVYGVMSAKTENAAYSNNYVIGAAALPANGLPLTYAFSNTDYLYRGGVPQDAMPLLPPGFGTTTEFDADNQAALSTAFSVEGQNDDKYYLTSAYIFDEELPAAPVWANFTTPAFKGVDKKVQATFTAKFIEPDQYGMYWYGRQPQPGDSVRIEYSKNGGAWQKAGQFTFADRTMEANADNTISMTVFVECAPTDVVRFRYNYTTVPKVVEQYGDEIPTQTKHLVSSIELVEARNCATPAKLAVAQDGITDESIKIKWDDQNAQPAKSFAVLYQKYVAPTEDEGGDGPMPLTDDPDYGGNNPDDPDFGQDVEWQFVMVSSAEALLNGLEANTAYDIKVQAVCGANDSSFFTTPVRLSTAIGLPYNERLSSAVDMEAYEVTAPNVKSYIGEPGEDLKEEGLVEFSFGEVKGWSTLSSSMLLYDETEGPSSYALSISSESKDKAWIVTPNIYVPKTGDKEPKTLKFKADPYSIVYDEDQNGELTHGIDLEDADLRLYVFASTNGKFTWNDTVASFAAAALTFEVPAPADGQTPNPKPGQELSVKLDKFEGVMQLGFYFHNPNADPTNFELTKFLQLFDIEFNYNNICRPVFDLASSGVKHNEATLTWKGQGAEYGIIYGETSAEESTYTTVYQAEQTTADGTQTYKLENLKSNTNYKVKLLSYCTTGDHSAPSPARTVTFTTTKQMFEVKVNIEPNAEAGTVTGAASYFEGNEATLTATANTGYKFAGYFIGENKVSAEATYKFTVTRDTTVIAKFEEKVVEKYEVKVNVTPENAGTVTGAGTYEDGKEVTLAAKANTGYKFVGYFEGETELSTDATYKFTASKNITITAKFVEDQANETQLRAEFRVSTDNGNLLIGNLGGIKVKDVTVYNLAGRLLGQFAVSSTDNLTLPVNAERTIIFVRLNTEKGVAVYKVYLQ